MEDYAEREWEKVVIANGKKWDVNISRYCQDGWKWYDAYIYHYEIDDIENALLAEDNYKEDYPDIWEKVEKFLNSDYEWEVSTHEDSRL